MRKPGNVVVAILLIWVVYSCENRDINEGEEFRPRQLHDNFNESHFTKVTVDGVEYLMMERDNNNPHEGFGFMAFRANKLIEKQDTTLAYLRTINEFQTRIYAKLYNIPIEQAQVENQELLLKHLLEEGTDLNRLEQSKLTSEDEIESLPPAKEKDR